MGDIVSIDRAGRLVVPKAIRTRLHLRAGTQLRVREEAGNRLVLEPIAAESVPVEIEGLLVIRGRLLGGVPDHRELRAERIHSLGRNAR
jgi:AbrB family looped-hinge helix DNA binding protein